MSKAKAIIKLEGLLKRFGDEVVAVDEIDLDIYEGEILTLLGPSGCGKSTTLRSIAGLEFADGGKILLNDENITRLPPQDRGMAMVFQNYALWPHLTVFQNVEYGLTVGDRYFTREEREDKVEQALRLVQADELIDRKPYQLSGGQQQRIAVARAIVVNPTILLLDEPFSNLDAKLRVETRSEIRSLVKKLGLTTIFVTHDQSEALSISDRIAIMNQGRIEQIGTPDEVWESPTNSFVATFIGEDNNLIECIVEELDPNGSEAILKIPNTEERFKTVRGKGLELREKTQVILRPQLLAVTKEPTGRNEVKGKVLDSMFMGYMEHLTIGLSNIVLKIDRPLVAGSRFRKDDDIYIQINPEQAYAFGGEFRSFFLF